MADEMIVINWHLIYTGGSLHSSINKDDTETVSVEASVSDISTNALLECVNLLDSPRITVLDRSLIMCYTIMMFKEVHCFMMNIGLTLPPSSPYL